MFKKSILTAGLLLLWLAPAAVARVTEVEVTNQTQLEKGLNFTLQVRKANGDIYSVDFVAPKSGKWEKARSVALIVRDGEKILLMVPLVKDSPADEKTLAAQFTLGKDMVGKCVISVMCSDVMLHTRYEILVGSYVAADER